MKFILSRTEDRSAHSKKWIVGYGLLFWLITKILVVALMYGCELAYKHFGVDPEQLTKFAGDPSSVKNLFSPAFALLLVCFIAPVLEECIFRLGLLFKKWQIALAVAAIPTYILSQGIGRISTTKGLILIAIAIILFTSINYGTTQRFWSSMRQKFFCRTVWISAIAFGLLHIIAFSHYSLGLIPFMLCMVLTPFFAGCAITYYRINLGFWWGVGLHIFNNLPAAAMILMT